MGGSGGRGFRSSSSNEIKRWTDRIQNESDLAEHNNRVNEVLGDLLAQYNSRDVDLIGNRLQQIADSLEESLDGTLDLRFGGSIAKHTYIDGISDVDALVILKPSDLEGSTATDVIEYFREILHQELSYVDEVRSGQLAVTVTFPDEMEIQLLPAVRAGEGFRIPASSGEGWSPIIRPDAFSTELTEQNQASGQRVVPVVKLAKGAFEHLPGSLKPSGYHVEALAIEAFRNYSGAYNFKEMLQHFFEQGSRLVLRPISDSTGQSIRVDDYLGAPDSRERQSLSGRMERISRRMANADRVTSSDDWLAAIGEFGD